MYEMIISLLSGLALFLFGMKYMSESLQQAAGQKLRGFLDRCTKNKYVAVIFGALFTAFIQSSGATTVMEVSFVNAGILTLEKSVGLTFGANIGTTITSQMVSLKLTDAAPFILFIGAAILMFGKRPLLKKIASVIFGFGALFQGIKLMTDALALVPDFPVLVNVFKSLESPVIALLIGLILTIIVQSSSVTVSVLVLIAGSGLVAPISCLYYMLGAYIGACTPAVMAAMNSNKEAKRTAFIHVMFNVIGMVVLSIVLMLAGDQVIKAISTLSGEGNLERFVANSDTIFKVVMTFIALPLSNLLIKLSKKIIKSGDGQHDDDEMVLKYIGITATPTVSTALVEIIQEIERMSGMVRKNLEAAMRALLENDRSEAEEVYKREKYIDYLSHRITEYMVKANQYDIPLSDRARFGGLFHVIIDIERIGDHAVNIMDDALKEKDNKVVFSEEGMKQMAEMYSKVIEIYDKSVEIFVTMDKSCFDKINSLEDTIDQMEIDCQEGHVERMADGKCSIEAGLIFTDLVIGLERIADHATNIAYSILPEKQ